MSLNILIVEDSQSDALLAIEALVDSGIKYRVSLAEDGKEALQHLKEVKKSNAPDLILLDLNMPRMNGHEVLEKIRTIQSYKDIPVFILTVSQSDEDIGKALRLGMNFYLRKPVIPEVLEALLIDFDNQWKSRDLYEKNRQ